MYIKLKIHSVVDLITNSSTEIFINSEDSIPAFKELMNEIIKSFNLELKLDDMFYYGVYHKYEEVENVLKHLKGEDVELEYDLDDSSKTYLFIFPKDEKYDGLAKKLKDFLYSYEIDAEMN